MRKVGSRKLKNRLGRYLGLVAKGETILVTGHGKPIAKIVPTTLASQPGEQIAERLAELAAKGHLRLGTRRFARVRPVRARGMRASRLILESRD